MAEISTQTIVITKEISARMQPMEKENISAKVPKNTYIKEYGKRILLEEQKEDLGNKNGKMVRITRECLNKVGKMVKAPI